MSQKYQDYCNANFGPGDIPGANEELDRLKAAVKIVAEFEAIFGNLTATERRWLARRISGQEV